MAEDLPPKTDAEEFLLTPERERLRNDWQSYMALARRNFLATIDAAPYLWDCFQVLDEILLRELKNVQVAVGATKMVPVLLMTDAHSRFRVAVELMYSTRVYESWSVFRGAIECTVHAHKLYREPHLTTIWSNKKTHKAAYDAAFTHNKAKKLFPENITFLYELKEWWDNYSDWGPHAGVGALALRTDRTPTQWNVNYFETDPQRLIPFLFTLLGNSFKVEHALFDMHKDRLALDYTLLDMRGRFDLKKKAAADTIIRTYNIQRPG